MVRRATSPSILPYQVSEFSGQDTLDPADSVPPTYSPSCSNIRFTSDRGMQSREGTTLMLNASINGTGGGVYPSGVGSGSGYLLPSGYKAFQVDQYFPPATVISNTPTMPYLLILGYSSAASTVKLFVVDESQTTSSLLTVTTTFTPDAYSQFQFSICPYGSYVYVFISFTQTGYPTPLGIFGPFVWDVLNWKSAGRSGHIDPITLDPPAIGAFAAADSAVAGSTTGGVHKISVIFVSRTGFISRRSAEISFNALNTNKIRLTAIPVLANYTDANGNAHLAAECTSRWIVMTAAGLTTPYKAVAINDNTTTTIDLNIADAQLQQQTNVTVNDTYLSPGNASATLPPLMMGIIYKDRMAMIGPKLVIGWDTSIAFISEPGSPQTVRGDIDFLEISDANPFPLRSMFLLGGNLYFLKTSGLSVTQDNGGSPSTWTQSEIVPDVGTNSTRGVVTDEEENVAIILDRKGFYLFNGSRAESIDNIVRGTSIASGSLDINRSSFARVAIDQSNKVIYSILPPIMGDSSQLSVPTTQCGDYRLGWNKIRWTPLSNNFSANQWTDIIALKFSSTSGNSSSPTFLNLVVACNLLGNLTFFDTTATSDYELSGNKSVDWTYRFAAQMAPIPEGMSYFDGIYLRAVGAGSLALRVYDTEGTLLVTPTAFTLAAGPISDLYRGLNITKERVFFEIGQAGSTSQKARVSKAVFMISSDGERPH